MQLDFYDVDKKWQQTWRDQKVYQVEADPSQPKYYVLDMFPYPSGAGLHVGHPLGFIASDIHSRFKRMQGFNVLHPMGYDAFGLPAEQYAIQTGQHPAETTKINIKRYREQLEKMGFSFDWEREISTCDPSYYHWTQWAVVQMFHHWFDKEANKARPISALEELFAASGTEGVDGVSGQVFEFSADQWKNYTKQERADVLQHYRLVYLCEAQVNWCPALGTVLANDEVKEGFSVRGNHPVEQKSMQQWALRITAYADRLLDGFANIDWPEAVVEIQKNWIGKSRGAQVQFAVDGHDSRIEVFTTRPDTLFGCTFMVLAPEHELVSQITSPEQRSEVEEYIQKAKLLSERDRIADTKRITGAFTGAYAVHPLSGEKVPVWIADYVIATYGTGAVMAVPAHDSRDHAFAKHFDLPIVEVVSGGNVDEEAYDAKDGTLVNSDFLNGLQATEAIAKMIAALEEKKLGEGKTQFRLRDAIFSRQRFWGEPFPIYFDKDGNPQTLSEDRLPLELPHIDQYLPTEDGDPPLARAVKWETPAGEPLDLNTMPGFAGSSAYFLRYMDPNNDQELVSREANEYWRQVDLYVGGREHATGHLIYSRFWNMFLFDIGAVCEEEPFKKLFNQGMINGRSNYVYRVKGKNVFVSKGKLDQYETAGIHVDIAMVQNDYLDIEQFKKWRPEFADAEFVLEDDGRYLCGHAVEKMSKSYYNVANPDVIVEKYGADTLRLYEMFLGPVEQSKPWKNDGIEGTHRFLRKLVRLAMDDAGQLTARDGDVTDEENRILHPLLKKVSHDYQNLAMNTAVSAFMIAVNSLTKMNDAPTKAALRILVTALGPMAPHVCEELWERLGGEGLLVESSFPTFDEKWIQSDSVSYPVSINGKKRMVLELPKGTSSDAAREAVLSQEKLQPWLADKTIRKFIFVEGRIINLVV